MQLTRITAFFCYARYARLAVMLLQGGCKALWVFFCSLPDLRPSFDRLQPEDDDSDDAHEVGTYIDDTAFYEMEV